MILIGILTTLCSTSRHDFLIFNRKMGASGECELWKNGMQVMKDFYCKPGIKVDKQALIQHRNTWFGRNRWWYDPQRGVPRNTQNPGNYSTEYQRPNHLEETLKWNPIVGLRGGCGQKLTAGQPRPPTSRSKTSKEATAISKSGRPERKKSKEQRKESIKELNKWGLGSVKCKAIAAAAAPPPAKKSNNSCAADMLKRKRDTPIIIEKVEAPYKIHADPSQKPHWGRAEEEHRAVLQTIRRNAELEEARIAEDKRLKVLREEADMEQQRIKRMRQVEDKGIDIVNKKYISYLIYKLYKIIIKIFTTVAYEFDMSRKLDELRRLDQEKSMKAKIDADKMQLAATLEMEKMQRLAREEEENRNLEKQRSERLFQAKLDERADSLEHSREDRRLKLRYQLKEQSRDNYHERQMDYVNARNSSKLTLGSIKPSLVQHHHDNNDGVEEAEEDGSDEELEDWMRPPSSD